jgi:spore maturation protein CgeB
VANSRRTKRIVVTELARKDSGLALYGSGWEHERLPSGIWLGVHLPNSELPAYYSAADVVLNDTWPEMAAEGFIPNRIYDAVACGAFVLSDNIEGIQAEFDGGVPTYADGADLRQKVAAFLADPAARGAHARRAQAAVLERHTFDQRADDMMTRIRPLLDGRKMQILAPLRELEER